MRPPKLIKDKRIAEVVLENVPLAYFNRAIKKGCHLQEVMKNIKEKFNIPVMRTDDSIKGLLLMIDEINHRAKQGYCKPTQEMSILEVGAFAGDATLIFSKHFKKVKVVDPWESNIGDITNSVDMEVVFDIWCSNMTFNAPTLPTFERMTFEEYFKAWSVYCNSDYFDMIYIDALHDYENVKQDIYRASTILPPGGIISGHDYYNRFPGVVQAVDESFQRPDVIFQDMSWFKLL